MASAVLGAAYTSAITHKNYGLAAAIAGGGLGITAVASATVFREVEDATLVFRDVQCELLSTGRRH